MSETSQTYKRRLHRDFFLFMKLHMYLQPMEGFRKRILTLNINTDGQKSDIEQENI